MQPFITVVIPTLNEAGYLAECIESLMRDPYPRDRLEVLIVQNVGKLPRSIWQ
jgi:succinoglycan biosynthesis protein ExoA